MADNMSHWDILQCAAIITGCRNGARCVWAVNADSAHVLEGTLRAVTDESGNPCFADPQGNIFDQWVRISAGFEHWLRVSDVLALMAENLFVINERG